MVADRPRRRGHRIMATTTTPHFQVFGGEHLGEQGALVIPSRLDFDELLLLENYLAPRKIVYLVETNAVLDAALRRHLEKAEVQSLTFEGGQTDPADLAAQLGPEVAAKKLVVFVPGKASTTPNALTSVPSPLLRLLLDTKIRVHPLYVERAAAFRPSIEKDLPDPGPVFVFAEALEGEAIDLPTFQENLLAAGEIAFRSRSILKLSLGYALLQALKKHGRSGMLVDGADGSALPYEKLLAASLALSRFIRRKTSKKRVGIILPPGKGGYVANIAVVLAGKIPVNLNFTASRDAVRSSIRQADLDLFLSANPVRTKLTRFDWPPDEQLCLLDEALPKLKPRIALWLAAVRLFSASRLASLIGLEKTGGDREAVLLFTSGSSGEPKGVILTHTNLLGNINQFSSRLNLSRDDRLLACLPLFHSFGCTVSLWFPLMEGYTTVTYPSPLEPKTLATLIEEKEIALVMGTPTFLRGYLRKGTAEQFRSVKLIIAGAEKLPPAISEAFEKQLGKPVMEGYGLTETSPVTNVNLPDPEPEADPNVPVLPSHRPGSVGPFLPGISARITHPETDEPLTLHETGMLWLRGPNIFTGYLDLPEKSAEVLHDRWLKTGDIARVDEDGFLYIEGRLSRFSKIGGEMVPHETVEGHLNQALNIDSTQDRKLAVVGIPDDQKGEALVLLCALPDLDFDALRKQLLEEGVSPLWVPKKHLHLESIPILASGKLDIRACQEVAQGH